MSQSHLLVLKESTSLVSNEQSIRSQSHLLVLKVPDSKLLNVQLYVSIALAGIESG